MFRAQLRTIEPKQLLAEIIETRADVVVARIPAEQQHELARLDRVGVPYLVADTLLYYSCDLTRYAPAPLRNAELQFREASPDDHALLNELVREIFADYRNHYSSNPLLAADLIPAYQEWVRSYATGSDAAHRCWLASRAGEVVAFATCALHPEQVGEGVLYGVRPAAAGGGVYGDLIRFTQRTYLDAGCVRFRVSTQAQNYAVQKVWSREGFHVDEALLTLHLNPLLSASTRPVEEFELLFSDEEVRACAELTGDSNAIHLDDAAARAAGLSGRIAHGILGTGAVSRYFGTVFPGHGTLFTGYTFRFLAPILPGKRYRVRVSFPVAQPLRGAYRAVAIVSSEEGQICFIGWCDLVRRPS
jgi:acyl dehydratase